MSNDVVRIEVRSGDMSEVDRLTALGYEIRAVAATSDGTELVYMVRSPRWQAGTPWAEEKHV
jgi:hypothetical protein